MKTGFSFPFLVGQLERSGRRQTEQGAVVVAFKVRIHCRHEPILRPLAAVHLGQNHGPGVVRRPQARRRGPPPDGAGHAAPVPHRGRKRQRPHGPGHRSHGGHRRRYRVLYRVPAPCQQGRGHDGRRRPAAGQPGQLGTGR